MISKSKNKIVVAMSGGVDSSTVAAMLHDQGHEVIGVTLLLYDIEKERKKKGACCAGQDIHDAKITAAKIGIPHYVLDYKNLFAQKVIEDFTTSYMKGETPIPCIKCNQKVKFDDLLKAAKILGARSLATGHYVRKVKKDNYNLLMKGIDNRKDQSYFLFTTTVEQLDFLEFPLGNLTKYETRKLAEKYQLKTFNKPESQDICFVVDKHYSKIIQQLRPESHMEGEIINMNGEVLGKHNGIINFTIGQRKGINISNNVPLYVVQIDAKKNKVIVGEKKDLQSTRVKIKEINWLSTDQCLSKDLYCSVRLRSSHEGTNAKVKYLGDGFADVTLELPYYGITPGQACVMYDGERVLGGGWITRDDN